MVLSGGAGRGGLAGDSSLARGLGVASDGVHEQSVRAYVFSWLTGKDSYHALI